MAGIHSRSSTECHLCNLCTLSPEPALPIASTYNSSCLCWFLSHPRTSICWLHDISLSICWNIFQLKYHVSCRSRAVWNEALLFPPMGVPYDLQPAYAHVPSARAVQGLCSINTCSMMIGCLQSGTSAHRWTDMCGSMA